MTIEELIAFDKTLAPCGKEAAKPEARWMPFDVYIEQAKQWNKRHPDDLCYIPKEYR